MNVRVCDDGNRRISGGERGCRYRPKLVHIGVKLHSGHLDTHQEDQPLWDALSGRQPTCCALASRLPVDRTGDPAVGQTAEYGDSLITG